MASDDLKRPQMTSSQCLLNSLNDLSVLKHVKMMNNLEWPQNTSNDLISINSLTFFLSKSYIIILKYWMIFNDLRRPQLFDYNDLFIQKVRQSNHKLIYEIRFLWLVVTKRHHDRPGRRSKIKLKCSSITIEFYFRKRNLNRNEQKWSQKSDLWWKFAN